MSERAEAIKAQLRSLSPEEKDRRHPVIQPGARFCFFRFELGKPGSAHVVMEDLKGARRGIEYTWKTKEPGDIPKVWLEAVTKECDLQRALDEKGLPAW